MLNIKLLTGALAAAAFPALALAAPPAVRVDHAAARVIVIPENRSDVSVTINQGHAGLHPLEITHDGGVIVVDGGLNHMGWRWGPRTWGFSGGWDGVNCRGSRDHVRVAVMGKEVALADLPVVTIRTPMDVHVGGSGAVFGEVGPSASLDLANSGCGDWSAADVRGDLSIVLSGSGDVRAGSAGASQLRISGSGDVFMGQVNGALDTRTSGSGDIRAASVRGPITTSIAGSGSVVVDGGEASQVGVKIAGSGDFKFRGVAGAVSASIAGSGDVDIARATGPVSKHIAGSGDVNIGR
jgi:hypothetical protein